MRLADELVHLRVRGQVHDEVDLGVLDAVDAAAERRGSGPRGPGAACRTRASTVFGRLSTPKTQWPSASSRSARFVPIWPDEPVMRMRIALTLPDGADGHERLLPARAASSRSPARSGRRRARPASAVPVKLTVVLRRVRPRSSVSSVRDGPSTSTSSTRPTRASLRSRAIRCVSSTRRSMRSIFSLVRHLVVHRRRLGAVARRVDEREGAVEADLLDDLERLARSRPRSRRGSRR